MGVKYISKLHELIEAVCPIHGVSSSGRIDFKDEATESQQEAAYQVLLNFNPVIFEEQDAARAYLNETDWFIIREMDTGTPCPPEIKAARQAAREKL